MYFDISNRLGVDHECDGQTDRRTKWPVAMSSNTDRRALKIELQVIRDIYNDDGSPFHELLSYSL